MNSRLNTNKHSKKVLILDFDLFKNVGGGQSSYRKLIEQFPENTYYYFSAHEPQSHSRPANAITIPFEGHYYANLGDLPAELGHFYDDYFRAWQFAGAVKQALGACHFDVVDTPDYNTNALFIRQALKAHGIDVGVIALALHGTISSALRDEWPHSSASPRLLAELRLREHLQYRAADVRYALSAAYATEWEAYSGLKARPLDPLLMVGALEPVMATAAGLPEVLFVGRKERRKGPDIFVDLGWCLDPSTYKSIGFVGADSASQSGVSSAQILPSMTYIRKLNFTSVASMSQAALRERFSARTLIVLPSRYDQFNLVALEALRLGCPTLLSKGAGAARWLTEHYPQLSDLVVDIDCSRTAAGKAREVLEDYDGTRQRIVDAISSGALSKGDIQEARMIYEPYGEIDKSAIASVAEINQRFTSFNRPRELKELGLSYNLKRSTIKALPKGALPVLGAVKSGVVNMRKAISGLRPKAFKRSDFTRTVANAMLSYGNLKAGALAPIGQAGQLQNIRTELLTYGERTSVDVAKKLAQITNMLGNNRLARTQVFRDMARLERKRGNDLIAATYCLRVMRWLGSDQFGDLDFVVETLKANKFEREAEVAFAMFDDAERAQARCQALLNEQYTRQLSKPDLPLEISDDRRGAIVPKVAVISSLYNAESKLATLLDNMRVQSLAKAGLLEIILVDSGSPTNEYQVFKDYMTQHDLPVLYVRSESRETIQAAWNRGIKLARAPYLSFLGVDEGLHPDALQELSDKLDEQADVDWVMADSIVTEVDAHGVYKKDVMTYDRVGYDQNLVYLETCYLSWVGGLYRKSIHDRFGYYDETFRAAGDSEFKSRILKYIKTLHVPKLLGVFNNYPEERTTQHPRAEIEDLRAWYVHRTVAGIAYSFDNQPVSRAEDLYRSCLSYRKSFCWHISTDFDMAMSVATYLQQRGESGDFAKNAVKSSALRLDLIRVAEQMDMNLSPRQRQWVMYKSLVAAKKQEAVDFQDSAASARPQYYLFNDNRYEQHWWSWSA